MNERIWLGFTNPVGTGECLCLGCGGMGGVGGGG